MTTLKIKKIYILSLIIFSFTIQKAFSSVFEYGYTSDGFKYVIHKHNENSYQHVWCIKYNGIEEYKNSDFTRVDCLTDIHAVEFDFANKWAESIGQALHYSHMTGKRAKVVSILENPEKQMYYFERVQNLGKIHNFDVEYVTPKILNIQDGKCQFEDCKCHKKKNKFAKKIKTLFYKIKFLLQNVKFTTSIQECFLSLLKENRTINYQPAYLI